jgi:hypothetical protein
MPSGTNAFLCRHATPLVDRDHALPLALALLAIVSLALAAATLDSAVVTEGASGLGGDDSGFGSERRASEDPRLGSAGEENTSSSGGVPFSSCWPAVREPAVLAGLAVAFLGLFAAVYRSTRSTFAGLVVCAGVGLPVGLIWAVLAVCITPSAGGSQNATGVAVRNWSSGGAGGGGGIGAAGAETVSTPTLLLILLVAVALAAAGVALLVGGRDDGDDDEPAESSTDAPETIGRVAGAAADRIDAGGSVDPGNEVYRAWREMTASLDVESPETTTPREFQRAAVEAGMAREDVSALTSLFESVRYGGLDPTEETERRAVETLRRIEASYGGE